MLSFPEGNSACKPYQSILFIYLFIYLQFFIGQLQNLPKAIPSLGGLNLSLLFILECFQTRRFGEQREIFRNMSFDANKQSFLYRKGKMTTRETEGW